MAFKGNLLKCRGHKVKLEIQENISKAEWDNVVHQLRDNSYLTHLFQDIYEEQGKKLFPGWCQFLSIYFMNDAKTNSNNNDILAFAGSSSIIISLVSFLKPHSGAEKVWSLVQKYWVQVSHTSVHSSYEIQFKEFPFLHLGFFIFWERVTDYTSVLPG